MLYLFSQFDNELRKDKIIKGMIENLRQGYWVAATPFGYTNENKKAKAKDHKYVINKDGEFLKIAFKLKAEGNLTNKDIVAKLRKMGCTINYKSFVRIIQNPFYCGYITHSLIPGEIYRGKHPALVTEAAFMAANRIISAEPRAAVPKKFKIGELPLKIFAKAEPHRANGLPGGDGSGGDAAAPLTGYRKKGVFYYKSREKGTGINVNARHLNNLFAEQLLQFEFEKKNVAKLKSEISRIIKEKLADHIEEQKIWKRQLTEINEQIERVEERYIKEEISKELFEKYSAKFKNEKKQIEEKLAVRNLDSSNLEKIIEKGMTISANLRERWLSGDFDRKQKLQKLVFPDGILYNKEKDRVRTTYINSFFAEIPRLASVSEENKKSHSSINGSDSRWVVPTGIEPVSKV
ncbi:MAG: recombinase family protein [Bacteroidetes bacterium]|nr:recombinase family protein [Bacteroidota bacterium]